MSKNKYQKNAKSKNKISIFQSIVKSRQINSLFKKKKKRQTEACRNLDYAKLGRTTNCKMQ